MVEIENEDLKFSDFVVYFWFKNLRRRIRLRNDSFPTIKLSWARFGVVCLSSIRRVEVRETL